MTRTHGQGARTPEELSTLLEDALIVADAGGIEALFETGAVFLTRDAGVETHGAAAIALAMSQAASPARAYAATPGLVLRTGDLALMLGSGAHVLRRGPDRAWRYAISVLDPDEPPIRGPGSPHH